ncbi:MAG: DUF4347 domain-containing protein [Verrucomicrobia bacterium]|nr:DUF4347 domain-containing protein [Verrucomicrobiota bacterium]
MAVAAVQNQGGLPVGGLAPIAHVPVHGAGVHQYVKKVFFDANVKRIDDVNCFKGIPMSSGVKNIAQAVNGLNGQANFITFCGHGAPGIQGLGSNRNYEYTLGRDFSAGALNDVAAEITTLHNYLVPGPVVPGQPTPVVFLAGCKVGKGSSGSRLLKQLSARMPNVLVVASEDKLSYAKNKTIIKISKLVDGKSSNMPIEFKFALNGNLIDFQDLQTDTGHDSSILEQELTEYNTF